jgi:methionine synthase I (cobalamin-dependent)
MLLSRYDQAKEVLLHSEFLEQLNDGVILADGGMGSHIFQLTGRLASP